MAIATAAIVAMMIISAMSAAYGAYASYQAADTQADAAEQQQQFQQEEWLKKVMADREAALAQIQQMNVEQQQLTEQEREELTVAEREANLARSRMMVVAGESGVSGNLVSMMKGELTLDSYEAVTNLEANYAARIQQVQFEKEEARRKGKPVGRGPANVIIRPSLANAMIEGGLGIAGAGADAYAQYKTT